jgi:hypothetical protein
MAKCLRELIRPVVRPEGQKAEKGIPLGRTLKGVALKMLTRAVMPRMAEVRGIQESRSEVKTQRVACP